ncbi:MAG: hypothetical protein QXX12_03580 [Nanopusillaceae archaeon]
MQNIKKISLPAGGRPAEYLEEEYFLLIWEHLAPYFRRGYNHVGYCDLSKRSLYVYCGVRCVPAVLEEEDIVLEANKPPSDVFFDFRPFRDDDDEDYPPEVEVVPIYLQGNWGENTLGYYIPEYESLVLSDVTHTKRCAEFFLEEVWPSLLKELERRYGFKPIPPEPPLKAEAITLGGDPEFEIYSISGDFVPAYRVITDPARSRRIGLDGADTTGELRPSPQKSEEDLIEEMRSILEELSSELGAEFYFSLRGDQEPCGGHIHIGFVGLSRSLTANEIRAFVEALDTFLGLHLIRCNTRRRLDSHYSRLGGWERKPWGFEYRTPPAVYLAHPEWARIVFKLAKGVVSRLLSKGELEVEVDHEGRATPNALMEFLAPEEVETFLRFVRNWEMESSPVLVYKNWELPYTPGPLIRFRDEWTEKRKATLKRVAERTLGDIPGIVFYGLRQDRGFVSTIPGGATEMQGDYPKPLVEDGVLWIGLPYEFRCQKPELEKVEVLYRDLFTFLASRGYLKVSVEEALRIALEEERG